MVIGPVTAVLARAFGRFEESWGGEFRWEDSLDIEALAILVNDELVAMVEAEVERRLDEQADEYLNEFAAALRKALDEWPEP